MALLKDSLVHLKDSNKATLCPLSFFSLVTNSINALFNHMTKANLIEDCHFHNLNISHLQFAYDTLAFLKPNDEGILNLKNILQVFEIISGLKVNWEKSSVASIHVEGLLSSLATAMGCRVDK